MLGAISQIPVLEKHRTLILLKKCKWRKVIFYEGYFVVFSIGKVGFQSISEGWKRHCPLLVYKAFRNFFLCVIIP